jgi:hypothetical protein
MFDPHFPNNYSNLSVGGKVSYQKGNDASIIKYKENGIDEQKKNKL